MCISPWTPPLGGAEEVFQRYSAGTPSRQYLLCWEDRLAEIWLFGWQEDPTPGQMAVIGEKLREG